MGGTSEIGVARSIYFSNKTILALKFSGERNLVGWWWLGLGSLAVKGKRERENLSVCFYL